VKLSKRATASKALSEPIGGTDRRQLLRHSVILAALNNVVKIYGFYLIGF